jgi:recombination protein RecA
MPRNSTAPAFLTPTHFARGLEGFRFRPATELQPTGIPELDGILGGGVPRGSIVEVCGSASSGRTSLCLALLAKATGRQETCAYVDVSDSLEPMSLASAGIDLQRLLWIRCGTPETGGLTRPVLSGSPSSRKVQGNTFQFVETSTEKSKKTQMGRHPRDQMRGIEASLPEIMRSTEGVKNEICPLLESSNTANIARCTGEQVEFGRQPHWQINPATPSRSWRRNNHLQKETKGVAFTNKPWKRLEQALKTADLLLHSGGWGVVVFDLGNISWVDARRIELSTWFRFRRAIENTPTVLLLLGEESCAKSCSSLVLKCQRKRENWSCTNSENRTCGVATLQGFEMNAKVASSRTGLQPMNSASWTTRTLWTDSF